MNPESREKVVIAVFSTVHSALSVNITIKDIDESCSIHKTSDYLFGGRRAEKTPDFVCCLLSPNKD